MVDIEKLNGSIERFGIALDKISSLDEIYESIRNNNDTEKYVSMLVCQTGIRTEDWVERIMLTTEETYNAGALKYEIKNGRLEVLMPPRSAAVFRNINES